MNADAAGDNGGRREEDVDDQQDAATDATIIAAKPQVSPQHGNPPDEDDAVTRESQPQHASEEQHEDDADADEDEDEDEGGDTIPYPEPVADEPLVHPPDFRPFFTLIEDAAGEHFHPTVHYVFTDDDPEIVTSAALESLDAQQQPSEEHDETGPERFIILDMSENGKEIVSVSSLSSHWQDVKTQISPAPSWGGDDGRTGERTLMLRILGQESGLRRAVQNKKQGENVDSLLQAFDRQLTGLDGVLGKDGTAQDIDTQVALQEEPAG